MPLFSRQHSNAPDPGRVDALGRDLLTRARRLDAGAAWKDTLLDWVLRDPAFKLQMFRFIDTFPVLHTPQRVHAVLTDYLSQPGVNLPPGLSLGLKAGGLLPGTLAKTVDAQVRAMAQRFIVGESIDDALPRLRERWDRHIAFSLDLLGEACVSAKETSAYQHAYLALIDTLPGAIADWPGDDLLERDHLGPIPRCHVSIKVSSLDSRLRVEDFAGTVDRLCDTIAPILKNAEKQGVFVNFDMEHHQLKALTLALFRACCERLNFHAGVALQAYLKSADADAQRLIDWSKKLGRVVTVRLVKGAYWDYERIVAERNNWPSPVWPTKGATDACFERVACKLVAATPRKVGEGGIMLALGSHNARSIAAALASAEAHDLPRSAIELQMLYGMADALKAAAVEMGCRVREYDPVGDMVPGMAYLVRRLLENTSNESWLKAGFHDDTPPDVLLAKPQALTVDEDLNDPARHALSAGAFMNEPMRDFADAQQRDAFAHAVAKATVPRVANDATTADADRAVDEAHAAFGDWSAMDPRKRSDMLRRAADILRGKRDELAGVMVREAGKPWREADGDVCEAIDFLTFYADEAPPLFEPVRLGRFVGEHNAQFHIPRGVAAVISPWNFPLAICTGMTSAALATGNCVIVKPAEQTPGIAKLMCEALWKAGVPRNVLHLLPGRGEVVGAHLVRHPRVALVAFTGSKVVGLDILAAAHVQRDGQPFVKHVVCEMGGKNAIVVDSTADLDEAVPGVLQSAFGYAGQKCSACSRVVVLDDVHDAFVERLVEAARGLVVGDPVNPGVDLGPVIDRDAHEKIRRYIDIGRREGACVFASDVTGETSGGKPLVGPHIFTGITTDHRLAREEVFGPVLAVMRANDFDDALRIANATDYKLTGGLYSRTPTHVDRARREFLVGNLYLNRSITGALVARQPFGGFGLSGGGTKAGGREYLLHFVLPRVVTENTLRRGFAPDA